MILYLCIIFVVPVACIHTRRRWTGGCAAGGADGVGGRVDDGGAVMHVEAAAQAWVLGGLGSRFNR